ncbi:MAG TPA: carboxypeptidase regulatory-like domain-containing protein [Bryobacteraceae bacterium]|nr:carboxypeptidase regulatory-like domain-containing protein [Bryobacteraceae bacterium]
MLLVGTGTSAFGQNTGLITGTVTDQTGAVIPNATVTIVDKGTSVERTTPANAQGIYSAPSLAAGDYEVRVAVNGFRTVVRPATVEAGASTTVNISMSLGAANEVVTVEAATAQINYESHNVAGTITRETIQDIPLNGRNMLQLATLEPGVTTASASVGVFNAQFSISVLGTANRTYVTVDGGSIVDNVEGGTAMNFSNEIVQEFQISQVNFDLGTGITSTGSINIVTRSGSNDIHGSAYFFYRDHNMAAYPGLARSTLDPNPFFARKNPGGYIAGPIKKNKLFYFFNYEYTNQVQAIQVQPDLPSIAVLTNVFSSPYTSKSLTTRFDYHLNDKHRFFLRYSHDGNIGFGPQNVGSPEPSYWTNQVNWADQGVFGVTSVLTPTIVNDFKFIEFYWSRLNTLPPQSECQYPCVGFNEPGITTLVGSSAGFSFGNNPITPQIGVQHRYQFIENLSWQKGNHRLRFGGQFYEDESPIAWGFCTPACEGAISPEYVRANVSPALVAQYFPNLPTFIRSSADLLNLPLYGSQAAASGGIGLGSPNNPGPYLQSGFQNYRPNIYAQDTWKIRPNLTVNAGLQYEREGGLFNSDIPKPAFLAPIYGSNLAPTKANNVELAPAAGFAWAVGKSQKTVIRGGGGIYWDTAAQYQRYRDRSAITPLGNGRLTVSTNILTNIFPDIVKIAGGAAVPIPIGANIPTGTLTNLTLGQFDQILSAQIPALIQQFSPTAQRSGPIAVSAIDVLKSGAELYPQNMPLPRSYQTSIGVQRDLGWGMVLTADYSRKITTDVQIGEEDLNHYNAIAGPVIPKCPTFTTTPGVECSNGPITFWVDGGRSHYNGLLMKVNKRFSNHLQGTASYAFQSLDTIGTVFNGSNYFASYGPALAHQNLNISGIIQLPWGFQLSVNSQIISRSPSTILVPGGDLTGTAPNATATAASLLPGLSYNCFCSKSQLSAAVTAFNASGLKYPNGNPTPKLAVPPDYQFGDPVYSQNFRLDKTFAYKERYKLQVLAEMFNAFNIANLTGYGTVLDTLNPNPAAQVYKFGQPTQRSIQTFGQTGPRALQVGARITF